MWKEWLDLVVEAINSWMIVVKVKIDAERIGG
jgi:hypothetical protein